MSAFRFPGTSFFLGRTRRGAALISSVWLRIVAARTLHPFQVLSAFFRFFQVSSGVAVGENSADDGADEEVGMASFLSAGLRSGTSVLCLAFGGARLSVNCVSDFGVLSCSGGDGRRLLNEVGCSRPRVGARGIGTLTLSQRRLARKPIGVGPAQAGPRGDYLVALPPPTRGRLLLGPTRNSPEGEGIPEGAYCSPGRGPRVGISPWTRICMSRTASLRRSLKPSRSAQ